MVEVYDRDPIAVRGAQPSVGAAPSRIANISTRGFCSTENNIMIGGAIVGGSGGGGCGRSCARWGLPCRLTACQ